MLSTEMADQVSAEVRRLKEAQDQFLQTYQKLCVHCAGTEWQKGKTELVLHHVRMEIIPIMEEAGMDARSIQALCAWAEKHGVHN